ncbi:MAG TPA: hypothetical protein VEY32_07350 [Flavisolibacter sp.]|nr:hypothetical protein [Flavisolibacter sp.]
MENQNNKREQDTSSQHADNGDAAQKSINPFEEVNQGNNDTITDEEVSLEQQKKEAMSERD